MSKRIVVNLAEPCPFCGNSKIFLKAFTQGKCYSERRYALSLQCSKCHVNGPQVFSEWKENLPSFEDLPDLDRNALIGDALKKWNTRYVRPEVSGKGE